MPLVFHCVCAAPPVYGALASWGVFKDPFGVIWSIADSESSVEDIPKELERKIIPYLKVKDASDYLKFLQDVFGAEIVTPPAKDPDGYVRHAELSAVRCSRRLGRLYSPTRRLNLEIYWPILQ